MDSNDIISQSQAAYAGLHERVQARAKRLGMDQADLSRRTGMGRSMMGNIWHGRSLPGGENLIKLAQALAVPAEWLITGHVSTIEDPDTIRVPIVAIIGAGPAEGQDIAAYMSLPRRQIARLPISRTDIWAVEMPNTLMPSVASLGDLLICEGAGHNFHDGDVIALSIDDDTVIRRVVRDAAGAITLAVDDVNLPAFRLEELMSRKLSILCRIVGAVRLTPAT